MPSAYKDLSTAQTTAGTTQATAAVMVADAVMVTSANAGEGLILRASNKLEEKAVVNGSSVEIHVYPPVGGKINNFTADRPLTLAPNRSARFVGINSVDWMAMY